jgi:hypothetical protein
MAAFSARQPHALTYGPVFIYFFACEYLEDLNTEYSEKTRPQPLSMSAAGLLKNLNVHGRLHFRICAACSCATRG